MQVAMNRDWDSPVVNYALGYADGLIAPDRRRNRPTKERFRTQFSRGLSDVAARRPFDPPDAGIPPGASGGALPHAAHDTASKARCCGG